MPIEVRHDVPAGMAALAGVLTGQGRAAVSELEARREAGRLTVQLDAQQARQSQQLSAQRAMQMQQIEAQADRQKEAADTAYARTALAAGLEGKIKEQQFDNQMEGLQEAARLKASQFEYEFTTEQKHGMARRNDARQKVKANVDGIYSKSDQDRMLRALDMLDAGETPFPKPADPNRQIFPEGQEVGAQWTDEMGNRVTRKPDGELQVQVTFDKTPDGIRQKHEQAMELKEMEIRMKREEERQKQLVAWGTEEIPVLGAEGEKTGKTRFRSAAEMEKLASRLSTLTGERGAEPVEPVQEPQELQEPIDEGPDRIEQLQSWAQRMKVTPTEADAGLPDEVALAQAFLRNANERIKKGEEIFPHVTEAYDTALEILEGYNAQGNR